MNINDCKAGMRAIYRNAAHGGQSLAGTVTAVGEGALLFRGDGGPEVYMRAEMLTDPPADPPTQEQVRATLKRKALEGTLKVVENERDALKAEIESLQVTVRQRGNDMCDQRAAEMELRRLLKQETERADRLAGAALRAASKSEPSKPAFKVGDWVLLTDLGPGVIRSAGQPLLVAVATQEVYCFGGVRPIPAPRFEVGDWIGWGLFGTAIVPHQVTGRDFCQNPDEWRYTIDGRGPALSADTATKCDPPVPAFVPPALLDRVWVIGAPWQERIVIVAAIGEYPAEVMGLKLYPEEEGKTWRRTAP